jgi:hypothetical protein
MNLPFKKTVLLFLLIFYNCYSFGQNISLSNAAKSALLLVEQKNPTLFFGHTAIRVSDAVLGVDVVYNYGALILVLQILL